MRKIQIAFFALIMLGFCDEGFGQKKKIKTFIISEGELKASKEFYSVEEALVNKKEAYILNLENQKLSGLFEEIFLMKLKNLLCLKYFNVVTTN